MARRTRLTETFIERLGPRASAESFGDGGRGSFGLILRVRPRQDGGDPHRYFVQRLRIAGRVTHVGIGTWPVTTLDEARETCILNLRKVRRGEDPRQPDPFADLAPAATAPTFREATAIVLDIHRPTWSNPQSAKLWEQSIRDYAFPVIGNKAVSDVTSADVLAVLTPIWTAIRPTAKKIAQRMSAVLSWAAANGYRDTDPVPAAVAALPKNGAKVQHHGSTPHDKVRDELDRVRQADAPEAARLAVEFVALTGARNTEARLATWTEIDLKAATWTIAADRRKTGAEHAIPLSEAALAVLSKAAALVDGSGLIFPGQGGRPMSAATLSRVVKLAGGQTLHGYRSSLRSWAATQNVSTEVAESLLGHEAKGIIATYQRDNLLDLRRPIMDAWGTYVAP